jgi:hypothetical protein
LFNRTGFRDSRLLLNGSFYFFGSFGHGQVSLSVRNQSNIPVPPTRQHHRTI